MDMICDGAVEWVQDVGGRGELGYGLSQKVYGKGFKFRGLCGCISSLSVLWIQAYRSCIFHRHLQLSISKHAPFSSQARKFLYMYREKKGINHIL